MENEVIVGALAARPAPLVPPLTRVFLQYRATFASWRSSKMARRASSRTPPSR